MSANYYELLKYAATGIASSGMTYYDRMRVSTLMGGAVQTLTGIPPLSFKADGSPLISWSMKGNGSQQTGTPTSDAPIMPTFCGVRTGNLFELSDNSATENVLKTLVDFGEDVTFDIITCSCVFENFETEGTYSAFFDYLMNDGTHQYVSLSAVLNVNDDSRIPANVKVNGNYYNIKRNITFRKIQVYLYTTGYNKFKSGNIKWAFYNSDKKDYEPYGWAEKITCAGQTTPLYLGEVSTTRRIKKLVLTGEENNWGEYARADSSKVPYLPLLNFKGASTTNVEADIICTHYDIKSQVNIQNLTNRTGIAGRTSIGIIIADETKSTLADFKAYLAQQYAAGTPVCVWYVLAEPETAIVNEPLCKIGDYADELLSEDAGVSIPTVKGANTLTVETDLQPSEMTIMYRK